MKEKVSSLLFALACTILCLMTACSQANSNDIVAEGETPQRVSDSYSFTEGPAVDARGDVYFTDQPNNKIYRWDCMSGQQTSALAEKSVMSCLLPHQSPFIL